MKISAYVQNSAGEHLATVRTNEDARTLAIPPKSSGFGSSVNGGELFFMALATCYCNDVYREAAKRGLTVEQVEVEVVGDFGAEGEPARNVTYRASVAAQAGEAEIRDLMSYVDRIAEIHNTLRVATPVTFSGSEAVAL
jgi:uncharacterized OsmC-like protein